MENIKENLLQWMKPRSEFCAFVDFDGVIADTEPFQALSYAEAVRAYGINISKHDFKKYIGNNEKTIYKMIESDYDTKLHIKNISKSRANLLINIIIDGGLKPNKEVLDIINFISHNGGNIYILSANSEWIIQTLLEHWSIQANFLSIFSAPDLNLSKSDFLDRSRRYVDLDATNSIVIEDSYQNAMDAKNKGAFVIAVQHSLSDTRINSMKNLINYV